MRSLRFLTLYAISLCCLAFLSNCRGSRVSSDSNLLKDRWLVRIKWVADTNDWDTLRLTVEEQKQYVGLQGLRQFLKDVESCSNGCVLLFFGGEGEDFIYRSGRDIRDTYHRLRKDKDFVDFFWSGHSRFPDIEEVDVMRWKVSFTGIYDRASARYFFNGRDCGIGSNGFQRCLGFIRETKNRQLYIVGSRFRGPLKGLTPFIDRQDELSHLLESKGIHHVHKAWSVSGHLSPAIIPADDWQLTGDDPDQRNIE